MLKHAGLGCLLASVLAACSGSTSVQSQCLGASTNCSGTCVELASDNLNCGTCGIACAAGKVCSAGACAETCSTGTTACPAASPTFCADTSKDASNCGACGTACGAGLVCSNSSCVASCPLSEYACGGKCIDPQNDPNYCGAASNCSGGAVCGPSSACYRGLCEPLCATGQVMCNGTCIDPQADQTYCGASGYCTGATAGAMCSAAQTCIAGGCTPPPCSWTVAENYSLTSLPPGSEIRRGAIPDAGIALAYGRTAFVVTSDWGLLRIPTSLAGEAAFATEVDVFIPASAAVVRIAGTTVFSDWASNPSQRAHGAIHYLRSNPPSETLYQRAIYSAGSNCDGWMGSSPSCANLPLSKAVPSYEGSWHTLRVEGVRASCFLKTYLDGVLIDTYSGACDLTGTNFILEGHGGVAFSNHKVFRGDLSSCVR
jgi:hypothetical protein